MLVNILFILSFSYAQYFLSKPRWVLQYTHLTFPFSGIHSPTTRLQYLVFFGKSPFPIFTPQSMWLKGDYPHSYSRHEHVIIPEDSRKKNILQTTLIGFEMNMWLISGQWKVGLSLLLKSLGQRLKPIQRKQCWEKERGRAPRWYYFITWI